MDGHGSQPRLTPRLTAAEVTAAKHRRLEGEASLACEGLFLTDEEKVLFDQFERDALPHAERRRQVLAFCRAKMVRPSAAE